MKTFILGLRVIWATRTPRWYWSRSRPAPITPDMLAGINLRAALGRDTPQLAAHQERPRSHPSGPDGPLE